MKKVETVADCTLWTPWGPQITQPASAKLSALRRTLRRMKSPKLDTDKREREDVRSGKPECAYEP